jgi:hypothetical protein
MKVGTPPFDSTEATEKLKLANSIGLGKIAKKYITVMFPYPSGSGLHIGHFYNYAIVEPGDTTAYIVQAATKHRHTYEARVQLIAGAFGGDIGARAAQVLAYADLMLEQFATVTGVQLGGNVNSCVFQRRTGLVAINYGGSDYTGLQFTLAISEEATPTGGS